MLSQAGPYPYYLAVKNRSHMGAPSRWAHHSSPAERSQSLGVGGGVGEGKSTRPCSHGWSVQSPWVTNLSFRQLCSEAQAVISGPENSSREVPESPSCGPAVFFPRNHLALFFVYLPSFPSRTIGVGCCAEYSLGIPLGRGQTRPLTFSQDSTGSPE